MSLIMTDLEQLQQGLPPLDNTLLEEMTLANELWLEKFKTHYLDNYLPLGGSKVKILVGSAGSGKTHLLRMVKKYAQDMGYLTVLLNMRETDLKFSDMVRLYQTIAGNINQELLRGLCRKVAEELGYSIEEYDGSGSILPLLMEKEGLNRQKAIREVRKKAQIVFSNSDLSPAFQIFAYSIVRQRMVEEEDNFIDDCWKWFKGNKLEIVEKKRTKLFDRLTKPNARVWLYSLIRLIRLAGKTGAIFLVDNLEFITERDPQTNRLYYTPNAIKDTFELIRQLIDDGEVLPNFLLVLSGRREILDDELRGLLSYRPLLDRLETGLVKIDQFNPFADIVDMDEHLKMAGGSEFAEQAARKLLGILQQNGFRLGAKKIKLPKNTGELRRQIMETALLAEKEAN